MRILLDSNVLVYAYDRLSVNHVEAKSLVDKALSKELEVCLCPQVLWEFFAVITNPRRASSPMGVGDASDLCLDLWECSEVEKITPSSSVCSMVFQLAKERNLSAAEIFDCVLAATAKENGVDCIYTENVRDFRSYGFLKVMNPFR